MVTKIAAFVLAGSVAALGVIGITDLVGLTDLVESQSVHRRVHRRIERHADRHADRHVSRHVERHVRSHADLTGTYSFEADGEQLGFPWHAQLQLELKPDGRYELRVKTDIDGESSEETNWGRYKVHRDRLTLHSPSDDSEHEFRIQGDRLELDGRVGERIALKLAGIKDAALVKE
jgi:hypothetical protein